MRSSTFRKPIFHGRQSGFTLMELIVSLAIGILGISISVAAFMMALNSVGYLEGSATKNDLAIKIRRALSDRRSLKITIEKNPILVAAFYADYSGSVQSYLTGQHYGVTIYDSSGEALSAPDGAGEAGSQAAIYYTTEGQKCSQLGTGKCRFKVTTSVLIQGLPDWGTHHNMVPIQSYPPAPPHWSKLKPDFIHFYFMVSDMVSSSSAFNLKPVSGSIFLSPEDVGLE